MFSLRSKRDCRTRASGGRVGVGSSAASDVVLPRWLRRPARMLQRLQLGEVEAPRFAATIATALLFGATAIYGTVAGGHVPQVLQGVTARTGFAIADVRITGNAETSEIDVLQAVGLDGWTALVGFDVQDARERLSQLPWVESVAVRKVYPATLMVEIVEKKPFAIWQHGEALTLVEMDGSVIAPFDGVHHAALPMLVGFGAREAGPDFVAKVAGHRRLAEQVRAYIRVGGRRWDLRLKNGITVKLPEHEEGLTLAELSTIDRDYGLLSRDVVSVDMRLSDRLAVELTPEAAEAHEAVMKERFDVKKKSGARI